MVVAEVAADGDNHPDVRTLVAPPSRRRGSRPPTVAAYPRWRTDPARRSTHSTGHDLRRCGGCLLPACSFPVGSSPVGSSCVSALTATSACTNHRFCHGARARFMIREGCGGSSNHGFTGSASASTLLSSYGRYARLAAMPCRSVAVDTPLPTTTCNKLLSCSGWGTATCNKLLSRLMSNLYIYEKSPRRAVWAGSRVMGRLASAVLTLGGVDAQPSSRHG